MVVRRPRDEVATSIQPVPVELPIRRLFAITVVVPVPPRAAARTPEEILPAFNVVNPDPLPVNVLEPILILPKPVVIEPEASVPTVARFERLVIVDVASDDTRPFIENKRPFNDEARFVEPVTLSDPVVVVLAVIDVAASDVAVVVASVAMLLNVAGPLKVVEAKVVGAEKVWRAVQMLACARLRDATTDPDVGLIVSVPSTFETRLTAPPLPPEPQALPVPEIKPVESTCRQDVVPTIPESVADPLIVIFVTPILVDVAFVVVLLINVAAFDESKLIPSKF